MPTATLSRGSTSVDIEIWREGGDLAISRDIGKPQLNIIEVADQDPRVSDMRSGIEQITLLGVLVGAGAYSTADALVENLIKPHSDGTPLQLDVTDITGFDSVFEVGVPSDRAVEVDYQPGIRNRVYVQLSLPLVSDTVG